MKGSNTLSLNQATIIEAVQCWVNQKFHDPKPVVKSVKKSNQGLNDTFDIELEESL